MFLGSLGCTRLMRRSGSGLLDVGVTAKNLPLQLDLLLSGDTLEKVRLPRHYDVFVERICI